ncbi:hypothetical protein DIS18_03575 [Algibacter marinivivus]|uniref:Uncharacterized protein n=2 Tax=Algibacter marinivivus TaxID=2100723 RepID=A0A2U2X780_9FLAO|nr:hypothetical protein DIS18_03575 [Algibacter marinivivus]
MFSDKFFMAVSDKTFDELTPKKRIAYNKRLNKCISKDPNNPSYTKLGKFASGTFMNKYYSLGKNGARDLRNIRIQYSKDLNEYKNNHQLSLQEVYNINGRKKKDYIKLTSSEYSEIEKEFKIAHKRAAEKELNKKLDVILAMNNSMNTLSKADYFLRSNSNISSKVDYRVKGEIQNKLNQKKETVLKVLLDEERADYNNNVSLQSDPLAFKNYIKQKEQKYNNYANSTSVRAFMDNLGEYRYNYLIKHKDNFISEVEATKNKNEIKIVEEKYLYGTDRRDTKLFFNLIKNQEARLALLKKQAEELQKQKEAEELRAMMSETTETGEPTSLQMLWALQYQVSLKNRKFEKNDKNTEYNETDNILSMIVKLQNNVNKGARLKITYFKKFSCSKSNKPGFICDYAIDRKVSGGILENDFYKTLLNNSEDNDYADIETSRFSKVGDIWKLVEKL